MSIYFIYIRDIKNTRRTEMAFLSLGVETIFLGQEKTELEYQEIILTKEYNDKTQELSDYLAEDGAEEDAYVEYLKQQQQYFDSQRQSIEQQLQTINSEIEGYKKVVDNNIKNECKLSISV